MNPANLDPQAALRKSVYSLLIVLSAGVMLGRILAVDSVDRAALEKNRLEKVSRDVSEARKRLEQSGLPAAEIEEQLRAKEDEWRRRARLMRPFLSANDRSRWDTVRALVEDDMRVAGAPYAIDQVIAQPHWDTIDMVKHDGHYYSSKPPLLATLVAGPYWLIHRLTGATLATHPYAIGRLLLVLINVIPLAIMFWLLSKLVERFAATDFARVYVMAAAALGTFLTTFAVVLNNHVVAAVSVTVALYAVVRIWFDGERRLVWFALAGLFAAFTVADELPALSLFAALTLALLWKAPRQTLLAYVPAAVVVAAGFFATNWIAHQSLKPPYMHRSEGDNWYVYEWKGRPSYWQNPNGIDRGEESPAVYAFHTLVGHHGIFSLTPIWLLTVAGLALSLAKRDPRGFWQLALLIAAVSLVCVAFYLLRPQNDRNYGGTASAFRWVFWFAPLWLVAMLPALDAMAGRRWLRGLALVLLLGSVLSASYPTWNPWTHPWIMNYLQAAGWL